MKNSILLAFLATDFCSGLQLFRLDNTFLLAFIAPSNFLTETISMRVTHITGPAHNAKESFKRQANDPNNNPGLRIQLNLVLLKIKSRP